MDITESTQRTSDHSNEYTPGFLILWFLIPGAIQGFLYYWMFISDQEVIGHQGLLLALALFTFIFPAVVYLTVEKVHRLKPLLFGIGLAALCAALGYFSHMSFALPESMIQADMDSSWPFCLRLPRHLL